MQIDKSLLSGAGSMMLLKLLEEKDMYGYEMIETLRRRSDNTFDYKAGTLYPLLHGLEERGFVRSYEGEAGGRTRRYYAITAAGRKQLSEKTEAWLCFSKAVEQVIFSPEAAYVK